MVEFTHETDERNRRENEGASGGWDRRSVLKAAGGAALVGGLSAAGTGTAAAEANMPTPWLHREGNLLKDPEGNEVVLRGVNIPDPARSNNDAPYYKLFVEDQIELATDEETWFSRIIRLPMQPQDIGDHGAGAVDPVAFTEEELLEYLETHVDSAVEKCKEVGAYIILDYHRHYPEGPDWDDPDLDEEIRLFWEVVAPRYADQSHVIYEMYNEPTTPYAGQEWGVDVEMESEEAEETWLEWRATAQPWVDLIREHAPHTLIIIGSPRWSQWTYWAPHHEFEGENLAYAAHIYTQEDMRPLGTYFGEPSEEVPVFMTEFGFGGPQPYLEGTREVHGAQFSDLYEEYDRMHWTAWCFDFDWEPSMLSRDYEIKNEWGEWVQEHLEEWRDDDLPQAPSDSPPVGGGNGDGGDDGNGDGGDDENGDGDGGDDENGDGDGPELDVTGDGNPAQDLTGDGRYEDVTGDGQFGFNDVVTFFEEHDNDVVQGNVEYFDFSDSGSVGFTDVISLFERL
ncbi:glycoside hydrolase family 5 protein [Natronobiforma cellulositropha]|uniref:glycoside hydrolase family 5 protein n=1 Tax=Natronobiforma cellulositropha TaxID=1679076 RepID=UPI0021D5C4AE|nr:glycoside hydrolase family 5 protein [Natronobiforma cellulositropha]